MQLQIKLHKREICCRQRRQTICTCVSPIIRWKTIAHFHLKSGFLLANTPGMSPEHANSGPHLHFLFNELVRLMFLDCRECVCGCVVLRESRSDYDRLRNQRLPFSVKNELRREDQTRLQFNYVKLKIISHEQRVERNRTPKRLAPMMPHERVRVNFFCHGSSQPVSRSNIYSRKSHSTAGALGSIRKKWSAPSTRAKKEVKFIGTRRQSTLFPFK